jgi:hypothetical protein
MPRLKTCRWQHRLLYPHMLFWFLLTGSLHAQEAASIHLRQPPPDQLRYSDLWEVDLINPTRVPITVQLVATVTGAGSNSGTLLTASTAFFTLQPGAKIITAATASELTPVQTQYSSGRVRDALTTTGEFPTGDYSLCVSVNLRPSSVRSPILATDCVQQHVEGALPPILLNPVNEASIEEPFPVFTWTWGAAGRQNLRMHYRLRLVEILGRQSAQAAMQRNLAWFEADNLTASVCSYPPSARALQAGHRYAWMVTVYTFNVPAGVSEVWEFVYAPQKPMVSVQAAPAMDKVQPVTIDVLEELLRSCSGTP